jgi:hypothetical protein
MHCDEPHPDTAAPADLHEHRPWSLWAKVLAYLVYLGVAMVSIWFIDRRVDVTANDPDTAMNAEQR